MPECCTNHMLNGASFPVCQTHLGSSPTHTRSLPARLARFFRTLAWTLSAGRTWLWRRLHALAGVRATGLARFRFQRFPIPLGIAEVTVCFHEVVDREVVLPVVEPLRIVEAWVSYLREEKLWGNDDPLFPTTRIALGANRQFEVSGLDRVHWNSASPVRSIFRDAFVAAGLPYFNPHSFRNTLVRLGQDLCKSAEEFKAWSQNLGHEKVRRPSSVTAQLRVIAKGKSSDA